MEMIDYLIANGDIYDIENTIFDIEDFLNYMDIQKVNISEEMFNE